MSPPTTVLLKREIPETPAQPMTEEEILDDPRR
jgi:hypothetical protein